MNIQDALKELMPSNPDHWTVDGMPRVDVMAQKTDNSELTRNDITAADPEFTREKSLTDQAKKLAVDESPKTDPSAKADEASTEGVSEPQEAMEQSAEPEVPTDPQAFMDDPDEPQEAMEPEAFMDDPDEPDASTKIDASTEIAPEIPLSDLEKLQKELEARTVDMYQAQGIAKEAKTEADVAADQVNALNRKIEVLEKADPHHGTAHIRAYLAQQHLNRLARAGRMQKFLGNSGVALKDVAKELDPRAPLDRAMHGRKAPRGTTRPVYIRGRTG